MKLYNDKIETFEALCESFRDVKLLKRGGQKIVFSAISDRFGACVIKLFFTIDDPRSQREIEIGEHMTIENVPRIFESGYIEYEKQRNLFRSFS